MISMHLTQKKFWDNTVEGYIFFLNENLESASSLAKFDVIEKEYYPHLRSILKKHQFEGKRGQSLVLSGARAKNLVQFIFIGIGKLEDDWHVELEHLRRAMGLVVHILKKFSIASAIYALPNEKPFGVSNTELLQQLALTAHMADYEFVTFKTEKKKNTFKCVLTVAINPNFDERSFALQITHADILGTAINNARNWADMPANIMTPTAIADEAQKVADKHKNVDCTIFGREKALELGMGGFCAVDAGSDQDGKFIVLEYKASKKAPTVALVGKGVAFDTGGVNLKPTNSIEHMKYDMTGAASVIALMDAFAQLKPDVNIISIAPCVENMPSGKAARPDDIISCMNGKTVEIRNTDAEGRLILADALCYAEKFYKPDYIIDIATLTGAVLYALGHFYTGLMTTNQELAERLVKFGKTTGDRVWQLPLDEDFKEAIKCDVADIHNNGSSAYYAGTIVGASFLSNFVSKARWAHLDVAGTAHDVTGVNYVGKGATGASMRLLSAFIMSLDNR